MRLSFLLLEYLKEKEHLNLHIFFIIQKIHRCLWIFAECCLLSNNDCISCFISFGRDCNGYVIGYRGGKPPSTTTPSAACLHHTETPALTVEPLCSISGGLSYNANEQAGKPLLLEHWYLSLNSLID